MERKEFTFISETDGLEISALAVLPEGEPKAILQLVHGMCEYKERYLDFMEYLAGKGYVCVIHDHRGHGKSVKKIEDLGYMYEGGQKGLVEDARQLTEIAKKEYGTDIPFYLLGHSMGSLVVRCYIKKYDADIDKLVVVGSPSKPAGSGMGLAIAKCAEKFKGGHAKLHLLDVLAMDMTYEKPFKSENLKHAWVNSDRDAVLRYNADPYCNYTFTINGYKGLIGTTKDTYDKNGWKMANPELPIAFFSGAGDPCAINEKAFQSSAQFLRDRGYKNVRAKMYEGMRHEVLNEPEHLKVYEDIEAFLSEG